MCMILLIIERRIMKKLYERVFFMTHLKIEESRSSKWLIILLCLTISLSLPAYLEAKEKKLGNNLIIEMNTGHLIEGELIAVHDYVLILLLGQGRDTSHVSIIDVGHIYIQKKSKFLKGAGMGLLFGGTTGALIGFASGDDTDGFIQFTASEKALALGIVLGVAGATIGGIGGAIAGVDETVSIKSTSPDKLYSILNKLKSYARYEAGIPEDFTIEAVSIPKDGSLQNVEANADIVEKMKKRNEPSSRNVNGIKRFHISVTPGYFKSSGIDDLKELIKYAGYTDTQRYSGGFFGGGATTVIEYPHTHKDPKLYIKDIKIDYSLNNTLAVGLAYSPLGQHGASGRQVVRGLDYREEWDAQAGLSPREYVVTYIVGFYEGRSYFLSVSYFPVPDAFLKKQTIKATGGIGYIRTKFDFYGTEWEHSYDETSDYFPVDHRRFSKDSFGILLSAELIHFFNRKVSIGLNVDYKHIIVKTDGFSIDSHYSYYDGSPYNGGERREGALTVEIPGYRWQPGGFGFGLNIGLHY